MFLKNMKITFSFNLIKRSSYTTGLTDVIIVVVVVDVIIIITSLSTDVSHNSDQGKKDHSNPNYNLSIQPIQPNSIISLFTEQISCSFILKCTCLHPSIET